MHYSNDVVVGGPVIVVIGLVALFILARNPHARPFVFGALGIAGVLLFFGLMWRNSAVSMREVVAIDEEHRSSPASRSIDSRQAGPTSEYRVEISETRSQAHAAFEASGPTWFMLGGRMLIVGLVAGLCIAVLFGIAALVKNPATRGWTLGGLGTLGLLMVGMFFFYFALAVRPSERRPQAVATKPAMPLGWHEVPGEPGHYVPNETKSPSEANATLPYKFEQSFKSSQSVTDGESAKTPPDKGDNTTSSETKPPDEPKPPAKDDGIRRWLADKDGRGKSVDARPDWLNDPPQITPNAYRVVVYTGLATSSELNDKFNQKLAEASEEYLRNRFGPDGPHLMAPGSGGLPYPLQPANLFSKKTAMYIERRNQEVNSNFAPVELVEEWLQLELGPDVQREVESIWQRLAMNARLYTAVGWCAGVLGIVGGVFGFLRWSEMRHHEFAAASVPMKSNVSSDLRPAADAKPSPTNNMSAGYTGLFMVATSFLLAVGVFVFGNAVEWIRRSRDSGAMAAFAMCIIGFTFGMMSRKTGPGKTTVWLGGTLLLFFLFQLLRTG